MSNDTAVLRSREPPRTLRGLVNLEPEDVADLVVFLASTADGYEKMLFGADAY